MMYDQHKRMIQLGSKVDELAERFFIDQKKRPLISGLLRIVETENSKKKTKSAKEAKTELNKKKEISKELAVKAENIKKEKQKKNKKNRFVKTKEACSSRSQSWRHSKTRGWQGKWSN